MSDIAIPRDKVLEDAITATREASTFHGITVQPWEYDLITKSMSGAENPEEQGWRWANAIQYSRLFGKPIYDTYQNLESYNLAFLGQATAPKTATKAIVDSLSLGMLTQRMNNAGNRYMLSGGTDETALAEYDDLEKQTQSLADNVDNRSLVTEALKAGMQSVPYMIESAIPGAIAAGAGTIISGGALSGVAIAALYKFGSFAGSATGVSGMEYMRMRKNGVDHDVAAGLAVLSGGAQGAIEVALGADAAVASLLSKGAVGSISSAVAQKIITKGIFPTIAAREATRLAGETFEEGIEEAFQQGVSSIADYVAAEAMEQRGVEIDKPTFAAALSDAWESAKMGALAAPVFGIALGPLQVKADYKALKGLKEFAKSTDRDTFKQVAIENPAIKDILEGVPEDKQDETLDQVWKNAQAEVRADDQKKETGKGSVERVDGGLYTAEETVRERADGTVDAILKSGSPTTGERYGYLRYEIQPTEGGGRQILLKEAHEKAGLETTGTELLVELAGKYPGVPIVTNDASTEQAKILVEKATAANPRGPEAGAQWFDAELDSEDSKAKARMRAEIVENLPRMSPGQVEVALALHEASANAKKMGFAEYRNTYYQGKMFSQDNAKLQDEFDQARLAGQTTGGKAVAGIAFDKEAKALIYVTEHSDFKSFIHESGHAWRRQTEGTELGKRIDELYGVVGGLWEREQEEQFTADLQSWLSYGKVRDEGLRGIFEQIGRWLVRLLDSLTGRVKVSEDIEGVFNELFSSEKSPLSQMRAQSETQATTSTQTKTESAPEPVADEEYDVPEVGPATMAGGVPAGEVLVSEISLSEDVPNFKEGASETTGAVEPIKAARYERLGTAPIVVWERLDGKKEVITGRHRLDLARRLGETSIPAQIVKESDGFTKAMAATFDAEANIRDGQGSVRDYANYFRNSEITADEASSRGLLSRDKGRAGYNLGRYAGDGLYSLYRAGQIAERKAAAIAEAAPNDERLQALGITKARSLNAEELFSFVRLIAVSLSGTEDTTGDLFGRDDSLLVEAEKIAREAGKITDGLIAEQVALKGALKLGKADRQAILEQYGVKSGDEKAIRSRLEAISGELESWSNWTTDAEKIRELRIKAGLPVKEIIEEAPEVVLQDTDTPMMFQSDRDVKSIESHFPSTLKGYSDIHSQSQIAGILNSFGRGVVDPKTKEVRIGTIGASHAGLSSGIQDAKRFYYGYSKENKTVYVVSKNGMDDQYLQSPEVLKVILSQLFDKFRLSLAEKGKLTMLFQSDLFAESTFNELAVQEYGITTNPDEAGYILSDGRMLDFSGKKSLAKGTTGEVKGGIRLLNHDSIGMLPGLSKNNPAIDFMKRTGAIRIDFVHGGAYSLGVPTFEAAATVAAHAKGQFTIHIDSESGELVGRKQFNSITALDVARFYDSPTKPETGSLFDDDEPNVRVTKGGQGLLFQSEQNARWIYKAEEIAKAKLQGPMPGKNILAMFRSSGVKEDELHWTGLDEFLGTDEKIKPAELQEYLDGNKLEIEEVKKGGPARRMRAEPGQYYGDYDVFVGEEFIHTIAASSPEEAINKTNPPHPGMVSRYDSYQIPGGENYTELLMTLPAEIKQIPDGYSFKKTDYGTYQVVDPAGEIISENGGRAQVEVDALKALNSEVGSRSYQSAHWQEQNVVAHARYNERTLADGRRMFFIEEIQSDWHQAGRKNGYFDPKKDYGKPHVVMTWDQATNQPLELARFATENEAQKWAGEYFDRTGDINRRIEWEEGASRIPDAPFKKTWPEMVFRRMLQAAIDGGFDVVGWTTGEQQAERYSLAKQVDSVRIVRRAGDTFDLFIKKDGMVVMAKDKITHAEMSDTIGKELSDKAAGELKNPHDNKVYSGIDLKVGGEGMKGFYDKMIVDYANKYTKKWGGKVEDATIPGTDKPWGIVDAGTGISDGQIASGDSFKTKEEAQAHIDSMNMTYVEPAMVYGSTTVHSLPVTDEMRASVSHGQVLFQEAAPIDSEAFKKWFGQSVMVDDDGKPIVMYHGSGKRFEAFEANLWPNFFFKDENLAKGYVGVKGKTPTLYKVYLSIQNMGDKVNYLQAEKEFSRLRKEWRNGGTIDGFPVQEPDGSTSYVPLFNTQIKSVNNPGTWDPTDPRILDNMGVIPGDITSPAFEAWFEGSKVVDESGNPLKVYHGSMVSGLTEFDKSKIGSGASKHGRSGFFFTDNKDTALEFANSVEDDNRVYEVYLAIKNPKIVGALAELRTAEKTAEQEGYDGIIAKDINDGSHKSTVYVAFSPEQIKSVNNKGTWDPDNPNILFQSDEGSLVVLHNIDTDRIAAVEDFGGLPMPSLAVTRPDIDFTQFGDATLIADPSVAKKAMDANELYDRDIWSPTVPDPEWKVDKKFLDKWEEKWREAGRAVGEYVDLQSLNSSDVKGGAARLADNIRRYHATMYMYLADKGTPVEPVYTGMTPDFNVPLEIGVAVKAYTDAHPEYVEDYVTEHYEGLVKTIKAATKAYYQKLKDPGLVKKLQERFTTGNLLNSIVEFAREYDESKKVIDKGATGDALRKAIEPQEDEYLGWIRNSLAGGYSNPTIKVSGRKVPFNAKSVLDWMRSQNTVASQKTMTYGPAKATSMASTTFDSREQLREKEATLVSSEESARIYNETIEPLAKELQDKLPQYYRYDNTWEALDSIYKAVGKYLYGGTKRPSPERMRKELRAQSFVKVPSELVDMAVSMAHGMADRAQDYYEAKPSRILHLSDFKAAVVPSGTKAEVRNALDSEGIKVYEYNETNSRPDVVRKAISELPGILFQSVDEAASSVRDELYARGLDYSVRYSRSSASRYYSFDLDDRQYTVRVSDHEAKPETERYTHSDYAMTTGNPESIKGFSKWITDLAGAKLFEGKALFDRTAESDGPEEQEELAPRDLSSDKLIEAIILPETVEDESPEDDMLFQDDDAPDDSVFRANRGKFTAMISHERNLEEFLSALWARMKSDYDPTKGDENKPRAKSTVEKQLSSHPFVLGAAISHGKNGQELEPSVRRAVIGSMRKNEVAFKTLYAEVMNDADMAQEARSELASMAGPKGIKNPKLAGYETMTVAERTAVLDSIRDKAVREKIETDAITDSEIAEYIARLEEKKAKLPKLEQKNEALTDALKSAREESKSQTKFVASEIRAMYRIREARERLIKKILTPPPKNMIYSYKTKIRFIQQYLRSKRWEMEKTEAGGHRKTGRIIEPYALGAEFSKLFRETPQLGNLLSANMINKINSLPLSDWSVTDLKAIYAGIEALAKTGRYEYVIKQANRVNANKETIRSITAAIRKLPGYHEAGAYGSEEEIKQVKKAGNKHLLLLTTANMDRFAERMDGDDPDKKNWNLLIQEERDHRNKKQLQMERRIKPIREYMNEKKYKGKDLYRKITVQGAGPEGKAATFTASDLMMAMLALRNPKSRDAFTYGNLFTPSEREKYAVNFLKDFARPRVAAIQAAIDTELSDTEKGLAELIAKDFDAEFDRLNEVMIDLTEEELRKEEHYVPIKRVGEFFEQFSDEIISDLFARNGISPRAGVKKGMTKERIEIGPNHQTPMRLDLFGTFLDAVDKQEHLIEYSAYHKRLVAVYASKGSALITEAIKHTFGKQGIDKLNEYIAEVANPIQYKDRDYSEKLVRLLRGNMAVGYLAYRWVSVANQLITSPLPYLAYAPSQLVTVSARAIMNPKKFIEEVEARSTYLRNRTIDPMYETIKNMGREGWQGVVKAIGETGMKGLEWADRYSVAIGWQAVYEKEMAKTGDREASVRKADNVTIRCQPSASGVDLSPLFRDNNEWKRVLTQFGSQLNVVWQQVAFDLPKAVGDRQFGEAIGISVGMILAGIGMGAIRQLRGKDQPKDEDDAWKQWLSYALSQAPQSAPLVGSLVSGAAEHLITGKAQYRGNDIFPMFGGILTSIQGLTDGNGKSVKDLAESVGLALGLPTLAVEEYLGWMMKALEE